MTSSIRRMGWALALATVVAGSARGAMPPARAGIGPDGAWPHSPAPCAVADATLGQGAQFDPADYPSTFAALDAAVEYALHHVGTDNVGSVHVLPGAYSLQYADKASFSVNAGRANLDICGEGGIASFTMSPDVYKFTIVRLGVVRLLNLEFAGVWPSISSAKSFEIINTRISGTSSECLFWSQATDLDGVGMDDPVSDGYGYIYHSEFDGCRAAKPVGHSMYLSNRGCSFFAVDSQFHSQGTLEVWRSLCRFNYFANNYISNVRDINAGPLPGFRVAAAVDFPSCGITVFKRNRIEIAGNVPALLSRARRSIAGCDMPNQAELGDTGTAGDLVFPGETIPLVQSRAFWSQVQVKPVPATAVSAAELWGNPALMPLVLWDNDIVAVSATTASAVRLYSTYPMDRDGEGSNADSEYLKVPYDEETPLAHDGWTERHYGVSIGDVFYGWPRGVWKSGLNVEVDPTTRDDVKAWIDSTLVPTLLPRGFESPVPSDWLPDTNQPRAVCEYFAAHYNWPDEPGIGFPSCDGLPAG